VGKAISGRRSLAIDQPFSPNNNWAAEADLVKLRASNDVVAPVWGTDDYGKLPWIRPHYHGPELGELINRPYRVARSDSQGSAG